MDLSLISTTEEHHHIQLLKMIFLKFLTNTNQIGDGILEVHITMDHSLISTLEEPHHTLLPTTTSRLLRPTLKLQHSHKNNTSQTGDGILEAPTTMDLSQTSTPVEHLHTPSPTTISKLLKPMLKLKHSHKNNTSQTGDGIAEAHTTMDHSPTSTPVEPHHTLLPTMISKSPKLTSKLQPLLKNNTNQTGDGILEAHITMDHSLTSTPEELHHTPSPTTISKSPKPT